MSSLFGVLSIATQSLAATQGALNATTDNIANVNTPDFTRRRAVLEEEVPAVQGGVTYGRGVHLEGIESVRDDMLDLRIDAESQQHGSAQAKVNSLQPLDALFSDLDNGLSARLGAFFDSLNGLAAQPSSVALRQSVLTAASNLANSFNQLSQNITDRRRDLDQDVQQSVSDSNQYIIDIARLNAEITQMQSVGGDPSGYQDQRTAAVRQLSELADVAIVQGSDGLTITTSSGTALVVGDKAYPLQSVPDTDGHQRVLSSDGTDITSQFQAGKLGALLTVRDGDAQQALSDLDHIAYALANAVNTAHARGVDLDGNAGGDLFSVATAVDGSAASIRLAITDPNKIAASSNGDPGSNGNLDRLTELRTTDLVDAQSVPDVLSALTFRIGSSMSNSQAQLDASESILSQLQTQRAAVSGVSLDEEAANLMRYQHAYQAAARVIDAANQMLDIACRLGEV
jgi:flagellar hook-associated protein 1 FlgK